MEDTINENIALATAGVFAVTLVGSMIFSLAAIVTSRELKTTTKLLATLCSLVLFVSVFAVFYVIAVVLFVPQGMIMD